jgi:hypothetical protein
LRISGIPFSPSSGGAFASRESVLNPRQWAAEMSPAIHRQGKAETRPSGRVPRRQSSEAPSLTVGFLRPPEPAVRFTGLPPAKSELRLLVEPIHRAHARGYLYSACFAVWLILSPVTVMNRLSDDEPYNLSRVRLSILFLLPRRAANPCSRVLLAGRSEVLD